ncbi:MAG: hypothetical protein HY042_07890 [Spirochaetia bacterium]|nr:hypothetical protein [Spirochaetia bacterium]
MSTHIYKVPRKLGEVLGPQGTDDFIDFLNGALRGAEEKAVADGRKEISDQFQRLHNDVIRIGVEGMETRKDLIEGLARIDVEIARVDGEFARISGEFASVRSEMREGFARVDGEFAKVRKEMAEGFAVLHGKIADLHGAIAAQTRWLLVLGGTAAVVYPVIARAMERLLP